MKLTRDQIREKLPWIREIEALQGQEIRETCGDCGAGLGEAHHPNCDVPRNTKTGEQRMCSEAEEDFQEVWVGIMYPQAHRLCLEENLFCRDLVERNGVLSVMKGFDMKTMEEQSAGAVKIHWHIPCRKTDEGAHCDLNSAMTGVIRKKLYAQPLLA